ncbi:MAG: DUF2207 domain-containing protein [Candidatus Latescibacterota bacterium]|nr:MAG: DUF2207 domain-containing protein [Candidatus Latescibacterota bacterium]
MSARASIAILACAATILVAAAARADLGGFTIARFHTDLTVQANADLLVEERIEVDFSQARHGIYRSIPVCYTDRIGVGYSYRFRLLEVVDEHGKAHETRVRRKGRDVRIRIGSADRRVRGRVVYILRYEVRGALRRFEDSQELYWNSTGHEWNTTIRTASATVRLPVAFDADSLVTVAYAGRFGSREQPVEIVVPGPGVVTYTVTRPLAPREGLTIVAAWPPGAVGFPGRVSRALGFLSDNWIVLVPLACLGLLWRRYVRSGRDPGSYSVAVRYEPPANVSPGGIGTILDEQVHLRDITATIVDLAVRGYLTIRESKKELLWGLVSSEETRFARNPDKSDADLHPHERRILEGLFESGHDVSTKDLENEFYKRLPGIRSALYDRLVDQGHFAGNPSTVRRRYVGGGFAAGALTAGVGILWVFWRGGVLPNALIVPIASGAVTFLLFLFFSPAMPRRTHAGTRLRMWALGFQEFTARVDKHQLEQADARSVFERLLPYAMALGVASKWAKKFEGIYDQAGPVWYASTHHHHGFSTHAFEQSLSGAMSRAGQSLATSPRSSGSGGGGFSGGGGGGGGGGSW